MGAAVEVLDTTDMYEIRKASSQLGGLGRSLLRSRDILRLLQDRRQEEFDTAVLQPLAEVIKAMEPFEQKLEEAKQKYDETENEIFGSQIRPLELKLKPLLEKKEILEKNKVRGEKVMAAIGGAYARSEESFMSEGVADVYLAGFDKTIKVQAGRQIGLSPESEIRWELSATKEGLCLQGKWQQNPQLPDQPLVVDVHGLSSFTGSRQHGLVLSMAPPDEGVKKLCAVAEWKGPVDAANVRKRLEELLVKCHMDGLIPRRDQGLGPRLTTSAPEKLGMFRKVELWLPVKPPIGKRWLDHLVKVATDTPAKNSTFYSLKDSPYTWYLPFAWDLDLESNFREKAYDAAKPRLDLPHALDWQLGSNMMDPNTFVCTAPAKGDDHLLALDHSSGGELAISCVDLRALASGDGLEAGAGRADSEGIYAVSKVEGLPLSNQDIDAARRRLAEALEGSGYRALDVGSFRLSVIGAREVEMWMAVVQE